MHAATATAHAGHAFLADNLASAVEALQGGSHADL